MRGLIIDENDFHFRPMLSFSTYIQDAIRFQIKNLTGFHFTDL